MPVSKKRKNRPRVARDLAVKGRQVAIVPSSIIARMAQGAGAAWRIRAFRRSALAVVALGTVAVGASYLVRYGVGVKPDSETKAGTVCIKANDLPPRVSGSDLYAGILGSDERVPVSVLINFVVRGLNVELEKVRAKDSGILLKGPKGERVGEFLSGKLRLDAGQEGADARHIPTTHHIILIGRDGKVMRIEDVSFSARFVVDGDRFGIAGRRFPIKDYFDIISEGPESGVFVRRGRVLYGYVSKRNDVACSP